jgi:CubicO group peptidase (beta-lactamase class C family)
MKVEVNVTIMPDAVDTILAEWDQSASPGFAVGIVRGGTLLHARGYGMANLDFDIPITPSTVFPIASVSKQFTAMAILLLVKDGVVSLDEDIRTYIPEVPDFGYTITLRHLIYHTSGLRDQWALLTFAGWRDQDVISTADVLDLVTRQRTLNFAPGEAHLYSNTGYTLMGVVVERVTGKSLRAFCEERMFSPLGMTSTHFHDDRTEIVKNRATAYVPKEGGAFAISVPAYDTVGASSLYTTVEDLTQWVGNLRSGLVGGRDLIVQATTPGRLNSGRELDYAFGLSIGEHRGLRVVEHDGGDAGYRAHLLWLPDEDVAVIALCNLSAIRTGVLCRRIVDVFLADRVAPEKKQEEPISLDEDQLRRRAGTYRRPQTGAVLRLEVRDGHLGMVWPLSPFWVLDPLAPDRFRASDVPGEVRFEETEGVSRMVESMGGEETVYLAVAPVDIETKDLTEYAGAYYSEELDVTYRIVQESDGLLLRRRKFTDYALTPALRDVFIYRKVETLTFHRDQSGAITGFRFSHPWVWNMWFARV